MSISRGSLPLEGNAFMGPLQDLATLALASVLREHAGLTTLYPSEDALVPWLTIRLSVKDGELVRMLRQVCSRAWEAQELLLSSDAVDQRWQAAPVASAEYRIGQLLTQAFDVFHVLDWATGD